MSCVNKLSFEVIEVFHCQACCGCRKQWGSIFSNDAQLSNLIAQTLVVLAFYIVFDGISAVLGGVIRGAGKQLVAAPFVLCSYYVLALPAAYLLAFGAKIGVVGLCVGTLLGTLAHACSFYILTLRYAHMLVTDPAKAWCLHT